MQIEMCLLSYAGKNNYYARGLTRCALAMLFSGGKYFHRVISGHNMQTFGSTYPKAMTIKIQENDLSI